MSWAHKTSVETKLIQPTTGVSLGRACLPKGGERILFGSDPCLPSFLSKKEVLLVLALKSLKTLDLPQRQRASPRPS